MKVVLSQPALFFVFVTIRAQLFASFVLRDFFTAFFLEVSHLLFSFSEI